MLLASALNVKTAYQGRGGGAVVAGGKLFFAATKAQPSGTQIWWQMGIVDPSVAVHGGTLSNALVSKTP